MKNGRLRRIFAHLPSISAAGGYFVGVLCFVLFGPLGIELSFDGGGAGLCRTLFARAIFFIIIYIGSFSRHGAVICSLLLLAVGVGAGYSSAYLLGMYPERLSLYFLHTGLSVFELIMMTSAASLARTKGARERGEGIFFFLGLVQAAILLFWAILPLF